jgi:hypothetical protein
MPSLTPSSVDMLDFSHFTVCVKGYISREEDEITLK